MSQFTRRDFLAAAGAVVACSAGGAARGAADVWADRRNYGPFQCVAAFPLAPLDGFFHELSRLEQELQRTLGAPPASNTVELYLLADEASYRRLLKEQFPRAPYRRALYVRRGGRGSVYAFKHADLAIDLRHECTHALLHTNLPTAPLWLDEGLAEYFEMPEEERAYDHPHLATLRWHLRFGRLQAVESLEACVEIDEMGAAEYRDAWGWVHFMLHGPLAVHRTLVDYLADIRRGNPPSALSERLRAAVPDLDQRMTEHFRHWNKG
jgi:hypothetical protein